MLTRLRVRGFKSLVDAEARFGPFTCIAGANGAGKSNLFDAIMFLRDLADHSIVEAAHRVRDREGGRKGDLKSLFSRSATNVADTMSFDADFIVPAEVVDDFGRKAKPSASFLNYKLELRYVSSDQYSERIELVSEELTYIPRSYARKALGYKISKDFSETAFFGERRAKYISTETEGDRRIVRVSQDGVSGRPSQVPAENSPRTVLGTANTDERPTILAAKREMQSWRLLQLEPAKLRASDEFSDDPHITYEGAHIPSALERVKRFEEISNKVADLLPEVRSISVDVDNTRRLKTLVLEQFNGVVHKARALSDGTLRFLALAIMSFDPEAAGLICLEEPENGIHPSRVPAILNLLKDMAVDPSLPVGDGNALRQVIINTHSPLVVSMLKPDDLMVAVPVKRGGASFTAFGGMANSWRVRNPDRDASLTPVVSLAELLDYLNNHQQDEIGVQSEKNLWQLAAQQGVFDFMKEDGVLVD